MIQRNSGVIVNVNSGAAKTGLAIYHLIVQASLGLAESLALQVDAYNIRVRQAV